MQKRIRPAVRMLAIRLGVLIAVILFGLDPAQGQSGTQPRGVHQPENLLVIGHRGAAGLAPENTLAAFEKAIELGVDAVEMDVQLSADGALVLYHDFTLKPAITRTADGQWLDMWGGSPIKDLSVAELKQYDVGRVNPYSAYARRYPDQVPADGERIPTLEEVIALFKRRQDEKTQLWIEIKTSPEDRAVSSPPDALAQKVVSLLFRESVACRSKILSFDWRCLAHVQKIAPDIRTVFLSTTSARFDTIQKNRSGASPWTAGLDVNDFNGSIPRMIKALGGRFWAPRYNQISSDRLKEAHGLDMGVFVWTVDAESDMVRLMEMGVDGIITNRPDILLKIHQTSASMP